MTRLAVADTIVWSNFAQSGEAEALGVPVSGTIGVLIRLVDAAELTLDEANQLLHEMIQRGYHSPVRSLSDL